MLITNFLSIMKKAFPFFSLLFMVSICLSGISQIWKSSRVNDGFNTLKSNHWMHIDANTQREMATKEVISRPGTSNDYWWGIYGPWVHQMSTKYSYNENGLLTEQLSMEASTGENFLKYTYEYDSYDNLILYLVSDWKLNEWKLAVGNKHSNTYNEDGNLTQSIYQSYISGEWIFWSNKIYEYNEEGNLTIEILQEWENEMWDTRLKYEYIYNDDEEYSEIIYWTEMNGELTLKERTIDIIWHNWDKSQKQSYTIQKWNGEWIDETRVNATYIDDSYQAIYEEYTGGSWQLSRRETNINIPSEESTKLELYENENWENIVKRSYFYDSRGNYAGYRWEDWEDYQWVVDIERIYNYMYNTNFDIIERTTIEWYSEMQCYIYSAKNVYSNFVYFEVDIQNINSPIEASIFPNPVNNTLNIDLQSSDVKETVFQIINITGQKVFEGKFTEPTTAIDVSSFPRGLYILRIQTSENQLRNYKILKE